MNCQSKVASVMNILKETYNIFVIPKLVKTSDDLANPSVGIRSTIGINCI